MRKEKKYNYIYKTTCLITNRFYIGLHSTDNLNDGYMGSGKRLWYSFKKHGKENHSVEILEYFDTRKELKKKEKELVNQDMLDEDLCMNLAIGGTGGILNEEHRKIFLESGRKAFKEKLLNNEIFSEEFRKKASINTKINHEKGLFSYKGNWKGLKHSEESKEKMSFSSKGVGLGKTNSQYGSMWITNEVDNRKISKDELIPAGWRKGRVIKK